MDLQSQWLDVIRNSEEPIEVKDPKESEERRERWLSWEEACDQVRKSERSKDQSFRRK
jgi:hypothetical protein